MRRTWVATLTFERGLDADDLIRWDEALVEYDGSVGQHEQGIDATVYVEALDPIEAAEAARHAIRLVTPAEPIGIEVVTESEWQRRAGAPTLPELVGSAEAAEMLGVSRQRVHQLRTATAFPAPLFELRTGPIFDAEAVRRFAAEWNRKPGRPPKSA